MTSSLALGNLNPKEIVGLSKASFKWIRHSTLTLVLAEEVESTCIKSAKEALTEYTPVALMRPSVGLPVHDMEPPFFKVKLRDTMPIKESRKRPEEIVYLPYIESASLVEVPNFTLPSPWASMVPILPGSIIFNLATSVASISRSMAKFCFFWAVSSSGISSIVSVTGETKMMKSLSFTVAAVLRGIVSAVPSCVRALIPRKISLKGPFIVIRPLATTAP